MTVDPASYDDLEAEDDDEERPDSMATALALAETFTGVRVLAQTIYE